MYFGVFNLGPTELLIILAIVVVLFGGRKLPQLGRSVGEMISNFRSGTKEDSAENAEEKSPKEKILKKDE